MTYKYIYIGICWWHLMIFWWYVMFLFWLSFLILMLYLLQSQAVKYADPNNLNDLNDSISNFCRILHIKCVLQSTAEAPSWFSSTEPNKWDELTFLLRTPSCHVTHWWSTKPTLGRSCLAASSEQSWLGGIPHSYSLINWSVAEHSYRKLPKKIIR